MSEKADFFKYLRSLGAVEIDPGKKHLRWQIGKQVLPIPGNLSGRRAFLNYKVTARRTALQEGLIRPPEKHSGEPTTVAVRERPPERRLNHTQSVTSGTRTELEDWNRQENEAWKLGFLKKEVEMTTVEEARQGHEFMRAKERLPIVERILREAGRPLTREEIRAETGWGLSGNQAIGRLFVAYPDRFRRTRGDVKRNERWELAPPPMPTPEPPAPAVVKEVEVSARAATAIEEVMPPILEKNLSDTLREMEEEFRSSGYNPNCAIYLLGRIGEIVKHWPT